MGITATKLRTDIYRLLDEILETGSPLEVERKGRKLCIVPVDPPGRLDRLIRRDRYLACDPDEIVHLDWSGEWKP